jgi:hypothetical protein
MKGTLNFYDDDTHVRIYSVLELTNTFLSSGCITLKGGYRRDVQNILMIPVKIIHNKLKYGYVMGSIFWDLLGFAEYVLAKRK